MKDYTKQAVGGCAAVIVIGALLVGLFFFIMWFEEHRAMAWVRGLKAEGITPISREVPR